MVISKKDFKKINDYLWEIPQSLRAGMRVPARVYADEKMLDDMLKDRSLHQLVNVATLPGIVHYAMAMPDAHEGYGFPIGGVAALSYPNGLISPGGIGYDINCGVRLLVSRMPFSEIKPHLENLADALYREIPSGVGRGGSVKLDLEQLDQVLEGGLDWALEHGYASKKDVAHVESRGRLEQADSAAVSEYAKKRGREQLGTMGAGNHFVEIDRIEKIFDLKTAEKMGLEKDNVVILIHTGSRGLGHQVATDYIRLMNKKMPAYGIEVVDRELAALPFSSPEGQKYFSAMAAAANFAWTNRQLIVWEIRKVWKKFFANTWPLETLYDVAHNMAKIENHTIEQEKKAFIIHRKGATRAFGPGNEELPGDYRDIGQPVLIPGSMGSASYVLVGTEKAMKETFGSACHGAGRNLSRHAAKRMAQGPELKKELEAQGIHLRVGSVRDLPEEAPFAYKDVHSVVDVVCGAGIAKKVAMLKPVLVIKG